MSPPVKLAVLGAGLIGRRHIEHVLAQPDAELTAIVDPSPAARSLAEEKRVPWFAPDRNILKCDPRWVRVEPGLSRFGQKRESQSF